MHLGNAAAKGRILHLGHIVQQEEQLPVTGTGNHGKILASRQVGIEAGVKDFLFLLFIVLAAGHFLRIGFPTLTVGRIGQHEIELASGVAVKGKGRAVADMLRLCAVALEEQICLGDGIGFRVHFLPEKVDRHIFATFIGKIYQPVLCHGKHSACAAGSVIARISGIGNLIRHGEKDKVGHEFHHIPWCPVFSSFFVVFFVETTNKFFEDRPHTVIIQPRQTNHGFFIVLVDGIRAEVDVRRDEFLDDRS